jgi:hypothetical protein
MTLLGMDPRAGLSLQEKLAQAGATRNAFLLDSDRQKQMDTLVSALPPGTAKEPEITVKEDAATPDSGVQVGAPMPD